MHNMRYILIPDVHGRDFWRSAIKARRDDDMVIFLGDYVDPYPHEHISNKDALRGLKDIIELKKSDPDHIVLLLGNHDMGYIAGRDFCSSRHWDAGHAQLHDLFNENINLFDISYSAGDILISHAGVYLYWMKMCNLNLDAFKDFNNRIHSEDPSIVNKTFLDLYYIDMWRGGWCIAGSPIWADIRCALKGYNLDLKQIVGHTQLEKDPIRIGDITCIDCRRAFLLEDGELKELDGSEANILKS